VSVLPSGNHLVRLSRPQLGIPDDLKRDRQAFFGNLEHRTVLNLAIETTEAVDVPGTFDLSVV
jgi:hypothetical protein